MNGKSRLRKTMAVMAFSVFGTTAHADVAAYIVLSVSPEPQSTRIPVGSDGGLGFWKASLEVESQLAIDLLMQQLTAARALELHQFESVFSGPVGSENQVHSTFPAEASFNQLATLETESSKAIEAMRRLLQQGQLPSNAQSFEWATHTHSFALGL